MLTLSNVMVRLLRRIEISINSWLTTISAFWLLVAEPAEAWLLSLPKHGFLLLLNTNCFPIKPYLHTLNMPKKLLILTQYFPPEVGAPQNRLFELAIRLQQAGMQVTVLTAMPNYPQMRIHEAYIGKRYLKETIKGLEVHRGYIYVSASKAMLSRLVNYFSFVFSSAWYGTFKVKGNYDFLLCESPPLFLGIAALWLKARKKAKLIFNVSDLWPETAEKLGIVNNRLLLGLSYKLEAYLYKCSVLVSGQTQGICASIAERFPGKRTYWLPNGVDMNYYKAGDVLADWRKEQGFKEDDFIALYAGIIGYAQGLDVILKAAQLTRHLPHIRYILLGSGPEKERLIALKAQLNLNNVLFMEGVGKEKMPEIIAAIDIAIVPLKRLDIFRGAIPSKIFENLAMKKPVLLGVDGEARSLFIDQGKCGWYFEPENHKQLAETLMLAEQQREQALQLGENGCNYVSNNFNRDTIAVNFYKELNKL